MRVLAALPVLAALSQVDAQGINFDQILAKQPALKNVAVHTEPIDRRATASSIMSELSSSYSKTATRPLGNPTTLATATKKATVSAAKSSSAKQTAKATASKKHVARSLPAGFPTAQILAGTSTSSAGSSCASQQILYSYVPSPDTAAQFLVDSNLTALANSATQPAGYTANFTNSYGSVFSPSTYLAYFQLSTYNIPLCTSLCDAWTGCQSVNLYLERDPVVDPGSSCANPSSGTEVRCALYGSQVSASQATNIGQFRTQFAVVILGSAGFTKNTPPANVTGFTGPGALAGGINVNTLNGKQVFLNSSYTAGGYDPSVCSAFCTSTTTKNKAAAAAAGSTTYSPCNYFNAFQVALNGTKYGTYCQLYTDSAVSAYGNLFWQTYNGNNYQVINSYGYALTTVDNGTQILPTTTTSTRTATSTTATATASSLSASCAQLGGTSYVDTNGVTYTLDCAHDLQGVGDIGSKAVSSFASCFAACDAQSGCQAIAYVGGSGAGTCYFKSLKGVTTQPNTNAAVDLAWLPAAYTGLATSTSTSARATSTA